MREHKDKGAAPLDLIEVDMTFDFEKHISLLVIQRSFGEQRIFEMPVEYQYYVKLLKYYKNIYRVKLFAYCLLESSIYLVLGAADSKIVTDFLSEVNQSFCNFISVRGDHHASLHIQRSRMLVAEDDRSLIDMTTFVESFPVKRGLVEHEEDYEWGSFRLRFLGEADDLIEDIGLCL